MKQIRLRHILHVAIMGVLLLACEKQLSTDPQDRIVPSTVEDFKQILPGGLPGVYHIFTELMTDNVEAKNYTEHNNPNTYSQWSKTYLWIDQPASDEPSSPESLWRWSYGDIYKLNYIINNVMEAEGDSALAASLKGEALITRAYSHFMLVNTFARHYDPGTAATDPGVPIALEALDAGFHHFKRDKVQDVYDRIEKDMDEGISLLNENLIEQPKYHFTLASTYAFYAKIKLFKGEWEKALEYAERSWALNSTMIDHNDFPNPEEDEAFLLDVHSDNYFTDKSENILMLRSGFFAVNNPRSGYYANSFVNIYEENDLRWEHNFAITNVTHPNLTNIKISRSYQQYNYPLFRTEEVLLMMAEAKARMGGAENRASAIKDLNDLRRKRFRPKYFVPHSFGDFNSDEDLVEEVLLERRKELCFEGHRWYDLRRNGYPEITHNFNGIEYKLKENDLRYVIQIPEPELMNNPSIEKNPR